jgi:hypothetical protein
MTLSEEYRSTAVKLREIARNEQDLDFRTKWENLALDYFRLAERLETNSSTDLIHKPALERHSCHSKKPSCR